MLYDFELLLIVFILKCIEIYKKAKKYDKLIDCLRFGFFFTQLCPTMRLLKDLFSRKMTFWQFVWPCLVHFAEKWTKMAKKCQIFSFSFLLKSQLLVFELHLQLGKQIDDAPRLKFICVCLRSWFAKAGVHHIERERERDNHI